MRFHGIDVPLQAGGGVQITKHFVAVVQFDDTFNNYPAARFEHPQESLTLPCSRAPSAARSTSPETLALRSSRARPTTPAIQGWPAPQPRP